MQPVVASLPVKAVFIKQSKQTVKLLECVCFVLCTDVIRERPGGTQTGSAKLCSVERAF